MTVRVGLFHLLVLSISWVCADARSLEISDDFAKQTYQELKDKFQPPHLVPRNEQFTAQASLCSLCEQFIAEALYYLGANKTQAEIMDILHGTCSKMEAFYPQCMMLVDHYGPLFFLEVSEIQPLDFCRKMDLCRHRIIASPELHQNSCAMCQRAVAEVLVKLEDPDIQLDIIEIFLKGCDAVENYLKECKNLVFQYGPAIMDNVKQVLETTDICTTFHVCDPPSATGSE